MFDLNIFRNSDNVEMKSIDYKIYHESLMVNDNGTTLIRTFLCIFFTVQCTIVTSIVEWPSRRVQFIGEYVCIILTLSLSLTTLQDYIYILNAGGILFLYYIYRQIYNFDITRPFLRPNEFEKKLHIITCMRGLTYLITVFCILAVDFQDFPRYLAKTEKYGYSLMDTGVGLFILMSGLVHKEITKENLKSIIKGNTIIIAILVIFGITRYISVKVLNYQEHVTEYGVHWNFFFTLAVSKFLSTAVLCCYDNALLCSIVTLVLHEILLLSGLQDWVFSDAPRDTFLAANREGIVSCLGYTAMYFFAVYLKRIIINKTSIRAYIFTEVVKWAIILWGLSYIFNTVLRTSRTLANIGYCSYITAITCTIMGVLYFFEIIFRDPIMVYSFKVPCIIDNINRNGLVYFLITNILTGLINMSIQTLTISSFGTFLILNIYMVIGLKLLFLYNKFPLFKAIH